LYGRETEQQSVVDSITHGECFANELTVLPIVGPGGIGKTTFTQHVYKEVKSQFQVTIWICVSLDFNANRLAQEAVKKMPEVKDENKNVSDQKLIEQRLKGKRFLLVLDDIWKCHEDEWEKLLAPFRKGGTKGNMVFFYRIRRRAAYLCIKKKNRVLQTTRAESPDSPRNHSHKCLYYTSETTTKNQR